MLAFRCCCSAAVWNCITSVTARMCNSRLGGRACLRRYTFLGICRAHLVAPAPNRDPGHPNNPILLQNPSKNQRTKRNMVLTQFILVLYFLQGWCQQQCLDLLYQVRALLRDHATSLESSRNTPCCYPISYSPSMSFLWPSIPTAQA